jgi:type II secretory pathway component GspD/PulD (secretin)
MDFVAADLVDVVKALSVQSGIDVVVAGGVGNSITVHLTNKPLEAALGLIASANQLAFRKVHDTYVIGTRDAIEKAFPEGVVTEVVRFSRASVETIKGAVTAAHPSVVVTPGAGGNAALLSGDKESVAAAQRLIAQIDGQLPEPTPAAPAKITAAYRPQHATLPLLQTFLTRLGLGVEVGVDEQVQVLTLKGEPEFVEQAKAILKEIDVAPKAEPAPQKAEEPLIANSLLLSYASPEEVCGALTAAFGEKLKVAPVAGSRQLILTGPAALVESAGRLATQLDEAPLQIAVDLALVSLPEKLPDALAKVFSRADGVEGAPAQSGIADLSEVAFAKILEAIEAEPTAAVLSRTRLDTIEGKAASLSAGNTQGGASAGKQSDSAGTGFKLEVTPTVDRDQQLTLSLTATLTALSGYTPDRRPVLASREAKLTLRLHDGQTAVVGGVLTAREVEEISKTPVLGHLPFFGIFFTKQSVSTEKSSVVLLVSPRIGRG